MVKTILAIVIINLMLTIFIVAMILSPTPIQSTGGGADCSNGYCV